MSLSIYGQGFRYGIEAGFVLSNPNVFDKQDKSDPEHEYDRIFHPIPAYSVNGYILFELNDIIGFCDEVQHYVLELRERVKSW